MRFVAASFAIVLAGVTLGATREPATSPVTWTGWFSDRGCAKPRVKQGLISPNNTECVKKCLADGATPVFISEQAKAVYTVGAYPALKDDVGWYVELTGTVDEAGKSIAIRSVKRLELVAAQCALPRRGRTSTTGVPKS
jgi:hypothetical protein